MHDNPRPDCGPSQSGKPYKVPQQGIEYNEFVGALGDYYRGSRFNAELHVRYGVRGNKYFDWSIKLVIRDGDVEDFKATLEHPRRITLEAMRVEGSTIVRTVQPDGNFDLEPDVEVIAELSAGDGAYVDAWYDHSMRMLAERWAERDGQPGIHAKATFGFASNNRDPAFRNGEYDWVRDTVVCLATDSADDAVTERIATYFPSGATLALYSETTDRMRFIKVGARQSPAAASQTQRDAGDDGVLKATGDITVGMLADTIYRGEAWTDDLLN